ncbi:hypothetical protein E1B28_002077 [Marasmius oreades]|nr:uncharacterized protein E1B28_002077 [Marasmius oreades]KAG7100302.1 hypothetical protein E1B28_002077 [Marasmius oreades]
MVLGSPNYSSASESSAPSPSHQQQPELPSSSPLVLYRLRSEGDTLEPRNAATFSPGDSTPVAPQENGLPHAALFSRKSSSSSVTVASYPNAPRVFIPYEYDPSLDNQKADDDEDFLHDPKASQDLEKSVPRSSSVLSWRGFKNIGLLVILVLGLLSLFLIYPIVKHFQDAARNKGIANNNNNAANVTGQNPRFNKLDHLIDPDTPEEATTRMGFDGERYQLVFSDEFNQPGRTFYPGDDPYFEAMDMWYGVTQDLEWYDPQQVTTRDGALVITMDSTNTTQPGKTPGSTAPFKTEDNYGLGFRSGMLQTWNKFCFTSGYIEVSLILPGPNSGQNGYWPGAWTMGNLGRPGYRATTDAMWPYSYDECDLGTFPNQTEKGTTGLLLKDNAWPQFDSKLSVLNGQRLSACTCPNSDHPGPFGKFDQSDTNPRYRGRGVPEIDILEVQKDDQSPGNVASQSAQFAPFSRDYQVDMSGYTIFDQSRTHPNGWNGSPLQQAVSGLTRVPDDGFQGAPNRRFVTYGFEYWADPSNRDNGFITWQVDGKQSVKMVPKAVGPDTGNGGSGVGQRLVPEEPMSIVLNLGISNNWAPPQFETLTFPAEMLFDYVRVYQREGKTNVGCSPKDFPTADYINRHMDQYTNINKTVWEYEKPRNRLYDGPC